MRLILDGFRQHDHLELELPETGLIQFQGPSGVGKTTVFDAIFELLTGEADDVVPWGAGKASVEGWLERPAKLYIKRTRGPETLTVIEADGAKHIDEAAQKVINQTIGMDLHDIQASSYIQQGLANSLLLLGPAEQLRFIQKLGAAGGDPEEFREKVQGLVRARENELAGAEQYLSLVKATLAKSEKSLKEAEFQEVVPPMDPEEMKREVAESEAVAAALKAKEEEQRELSRALQKPIYKIIRGISQMRAETAAMIAENDAEVAKLSTEIDAGDASKKDLSYHAEVKARCAQKKKRLEVLEEIRAHGARVQEKYKSTERASVLLDRRAQEILERLAAIDAEDRKILEEIDTLMAAKTPQPCPECGKPLLVEGGHRIIKLSAPVAPADRGEQVTALHIRREALGQEEESLKKENSWIAYTRRTVETLVAALPADVPEYPTMAEVIAAQDKIHIEATEQTALWATVAGLAKARTRLIEKSTAKSLELKRAEAAVNAEPGLESEESLAARVAQVNTEASALAKELISYNEVRAMHSDYIVAVHFRNQKAALYTERLKVFKQHEAEVAEKATAVSAAQKRLAAAVRLRERSDQAAMMAIEMTLEQINQTAGALISRMFPDDGTSIKLKNITQTKKGDQRPKLSMEIFHKGKMAKKIKSLSGGERSRAYLCFQLALSELYKSPFLMVDEGFAGLPEEQVKECLEVLREASEKKLILVIEHGAPESLFDQVIRFDSTGLAQNG